MEGAAEHRGIIDDEVVNHSRTSRDGRLTSPTSYENQEDAWSRAGLMSVNGFTERRVEGRFAGPQLEGLKAQHGCRAERKR